MITPRSRLRSLRRFNRIFTQKQQQQQQPSRRPFHSNSNHAPSHSHCHYQPVFNISNVAPLLPTRRSCSPFAVVASTNFPSSKQNIPPAVRIARAPSVAKTATSPVPKPLLPFDSNTSLMSTKLHNGSDHEPPDERLLKLGKTLRILSSHLPTIFISPLPHEILSPNIRLHLFPSTHPHLPVVKGRMPYIAALWTAPLAWGHLPIFGHVEIEVLTERMANQSGHADFMCDMDEEERGDIHGTERLVVRWQTQGKEHNQRPPKTTASSSSNTGHRSNEQHRDDNYDYAQQKNKNREEDFSLSQSSAATNSNRSLSVLLGGDAPIFKLKNEENFTGMFVFRFDQHGRIASHTIEHSEDNCSASRASKVVTLTDWLLGLKDRLNAPPGNAGSGNTPSPVMTKRCPAR